MRRIRRAHFLVLPLMLLAVGLLASCGVTPTPCDPVVEFTVTGDLDASASKLAAAVVIPAGAERTYQINFGAARGLFVVEAVPAEAGPGFEVKLLNSRCRVLGVSNQAALFGATALPAGVSQLETQAVEAAQGDDLADVDPLAIAVTWTCVGPCVATPGVAGIYYLTVTNRSSSSRFFDIYGYAPPLADTNEPNDHQAMATSASGLSTLSGAIEWVGDEDWFRYTGSVVRSLELTAESAALGLRLAIPGVGQVASGERIDIFPNERFVVFSAANRAGAPELSGYSVSFAAPTTAANLTATTSPDVLVTTNIPAGGSRSYLVNVPLPNDLFFAEVEGAGLRVQINSLIDGPLVASNSPQFFAAASAVPLRVGEVVERSEGVELGPQSVVLSHRCLGPCAAVAPSDPRYLVEVRNVSGSSVSAKILAYTIPAGDLADRGSSTNNRSARALVVPAPTTLRGAIELVGDDDWFRYTGPHATLRLLPDNDALDLRVQFAASFGSDAPNTSLALPSGSYFKVYSRANRAGPSDASAYSLVIE